MAIRFIAETEDGQSFRILVDFGANDTCLTQDLANALRLVCSENHDPYPSVTVDGSGVLVDQSTYFTFLIGDYSEGDWVDVIPGSGMEMVVGYDWFECYNPRIDWRAKTVEFEDENDDPVVLQGLLDDEEVAG